MDVDKNGVPILSELLNLEQAFEQPVDLDEVTADLEALLDQADEELAKFMERTDDGPQQEA